MSDPVDNEQEVSEEDLNALASLLSSPDMWGPADPALEDSIVAAIANEAAAVETPEVPDFESDVTAPTLAAVRDPAPTPAPGVDPAPRATVDAAHEDDGLAAVIPISRFRRTAVTFLAGAAAAAALIFGIGSFVGNDEEGVFLALEATDLAPEATAEVELVETPIGTLIRLDVADLPPSPPGSYYEAWLRIDGETGVSAGTFHLRGGDGEIVLWAGVSPETYPLFTITIQDEAQPESSGVVVLRGRLGE